MDIEKGEDYSHGWCCPLRWPCPDCGLPGGVEHPASALCPARGDRCNCNDGSESSAPKNRSNPMGDDAYIWRCANGHEAAVSETEVRQSVIAPRCPIVVEGEVCMAKLVERVREFPPETSR